MRSTSVLVTGPMRGVLRHNGDDVLSLVGVLSVVAELLASMDLDPDDAASAARWWESQNEQRRAASLYRRALPWLEGGADWSWAASRLAAICRREGERDEAARLWQALWRAGDRSSGLRLAIHLEHHERRLPEAKALTERLLDGAPVAEGPPLAHRLRRLERKLERLQGGEVNFSMGCQTREPRSFRDAIPEP